MRAEAISAKEFAEILSVSESTISRRAKRDGHVLGVPALRLGRAVRFSKIQVDRLLARRAEVAS